MAQIGIRNGQLSVLKSEKPQGVQRDLEIITERDFKHGVISLGIRLLETAELDRNCPFILITDEDSTSCGILAAAVRRQCVLVVIDKRRKALVDYVIQETGIHSVFVVKHENKCIQKYPHGCEFVRPDKDAWLHQDPISSCGGIGFLTSGSLGRPKIVIHSWESVKKQAEISRQLLLSHIYSEFQLIFCTSIAHAFSFNALCTFLAHIDYQEDHSSPHSSDLVLVAGDYKGLLRLVSKAASKHPRKHRVLYGTPGTYTTLLEATESELPLDIDVPFCAGALLDPKLYMRVSKVFHCRLIQNYGSTETGVIACWEAVDASKSAEKEEKIYLTSTSVADGDRKTYVGVPIPGVHVDIDQNLGELLTQTPYSCIGYVRNQRLDKFESQMYRTGDRSTIEIIDRLDQPQVYLFGRIRPRITVGDSAHRTFYEPLQLEKILCKHPSVTDALLISTCGKSESDILIRIVQDATCTLTVGALKESLIVWLEENRISLPDKSFRLEVVENLECSPAGKLIYR